MMSYLSIKFCLLGKRQQLDYFNYGNTSSTAIIIQGSDSTDMSVVNIYICSLV